MLVPGNAIGRKEYSSRRRVQLSTSKACFFKVSVKNENLKLVLSIGCI